MKPIAKMLLRAGRGTLVCLGFALVLALVGCSGSSGGGGGGGGGGETPGTGDTAQALATWLAAAMVYTDFGSHFSSNYLDAGETLADLPSKDPFSATPTLLGGPAPLATTTTPITLGTVLTGPTEVTVPAGDYQVYTLTLAAAQQVTFLTTSFYMDVTLNNANKERLRDLRDSFSSDSSGNCRVTLNLAAGTYNIVANNAESSFAYEVTYLAVQDGSADALTPIFPGLTDTRVALLPGTTDRYLITGAMTDGTYSYSTVDLIGPLVIESGAYVLHGNQRQHRTSFWTGHGIGFGEFPFDAYWVDRPEVQGKSITAATVEATGDLQIFDAITLVVKPGPQALSCNAYPGGMDCGGFADFSGDIRINPAVTTAPTGTVIVVSTYPAGTDTQTFTVGPSEFLAGGTVSSTVGTDTATFSWSGWPTSGLVAHGAEIYVCAPSICDYKRDSTVSASGSLTGTQAGATDYLSAKWMEGVVAADHYTEIYKDASDLIGNAVGAFSLSRARTGSRRSPLRYSNPLHR